MKDNILKAIERNDSEFILEEGSVRYQMEEYGKSFEYYQLASAMGNKNAMGKIGCCYLNGTIVSQNLQLAYYYFTISADECIDSLYKLGNMYERGLYVLNDEEQANYYYNKAIEKSQKDGVEDNYPNLYLTVAKRMINQNDNLAYSYLLIAKKGYEKALDDWEVYYEDQENLKEVLELLNKIKQEKGDL